MYDKEKNHNMVDEAWIGSLVLFFPVHFIMAVDAAVIILTLCACFLVCLLHAFFPF